MLKSSFWIGACLLAATLSSANIASAQATRTWVSGVGDDVNPCSRTAPCKTFAGAISKTAQGGEINALDSGGFGSLTITKSISLLADGTVGGVLSSGVNGLTINAGPTDTVYIDGLDIEGLNQPNSATTGRAGIKIVQAGKVVIRNTTIRNFVGNSGYPAGPANGTAVLVQSTSPVDVLLENVILSNNLRGIYTGSTVTQRVFVRNSSVFGNSLGGVVVDGKSSTSYLSGSTVFGNSPDLSRLNGGRILKNR